MSASASQRTVGSGSGKEALERLFWQAGNLGPMAGEFSRFVAAERGDHGMLRHGTAAA